jgi:hypothetical protein
MAKKSKASRVDQSGCSQIENARALDDTGGKDWPPGQKNRRRDKTVSLFLEHLVGNAWLEMHAA